MVFIFREVFVLFVRMYVLLRCSHPLFTCGTCCCRLTHQRVAMAVHAKPMDLRPVARPLPALPGRGNVPLYEAGWTSPSSTEYEIPVAPHNGAAHIPGSTEYEIPVAPRISAWANADRHGTLQDRMYDRASATTNTAC